MNITGNSLKLPGANLGDELLLDTAPRGFLFDGVRLNIMMPVDVTGTPTPAATDLKPFVQRAIGNLTLEEGPKKNRRLVYAATDGNDHRTIHRHYERNDLQSDFVGKAQVAGNGQAFHATIFIPFTPPSFYAGRVRRPGTSQVRTMKLKVVEGAAAAFGTAGLVRSAAGNIVIEVEYVIAQPGRDAWAPIPSLQRENSPRRDATGPDGLTLLAYVPDSPAATSPLNAFNVQIGGERVTDLQSVASVMRAYADDMVDQGANPAAITDENTVLHYLADGADLDKAPHGRLRFEEAKSDLSPINLRVLYLPPMDSAYMRAAAKQTADEQRSAVLLSQPVIGDDDSPGAAAVQGATVYVPADARYTLLPGQLAAPGSDVVRVSMPAHYVERAKQAAAAVRGQGQRVADDAHRRAVKLASLAVPGVTATDGSRQGASADEVEQAFR